MTRLITVASGKGGVGKTTMVANLGAALAQMGKDVLIVDANLTTPNLGLHLGMPLPSVTLHDVLAGDAFITEAIAMHPSGIRVIPAGISLNDLKRADPRELGDIVLDLIGVSDIVLIDAPAGLEEGGVAALEAGDDLLLVTNPELPAITDALKTRKIAEEVGTDCIGVILNRVRNEITETTVNEVEAMVDAPVIGIVPEDLEVRKAIAAKNPVVIANPNAPASIAIKQIAAQLVGEVYIPPKVAVAREGLFTRILRFLRLK